MPETRTTNSVILHGALGKMGRELVPLLREAGYTITGLIERNDHPQLGRQPYGPELPTLTDLSQCTLPPGCTVIDFASPDALMALLPRCRSARVGLLSGTTGLSAEQKELLSEAGWEIPVLWSANFSPGIAVLRKLIATAARQLGPDYAVSIVETHHAAKKDAPSGTALTLAGTLREAGIADVPTSSLRGGTVPGTHEVHFLGPWESLILTHRAEGRTLFARGVMRVLPWFVDQPAGLYDLGNALDAE